ncbi:MAG: ABC transporter ATP-binding protein [Deltaproteobacteria bacterium]|nr:MAG: ABC transporter ATP-binding protein [Deltaproteobacteria bacterium]
MNDIITCRQLTKNYQRGSVVTPALRGVTLTIPRGSFTCIIGPSGHGKSTLMHLLGGLDRPTSGSVSLDGIALDTLDERALAEVRSRKIGFVFQFFNLLNNLTARENVELALMLAGVPGSRQTARAGDLLARVGLADRADYRPAQLSGGQQQRVAIARALANNPPLLLMDEPTGNLDSEAEAEILAILKSLHAEGTTVVLVTHNAEIAARAEQIIRVRDGLAFMTAEDAAAGRLVA